MKKIYIAGCGGMLGEAFYMQFQRDYELKCTDIDVNEKWLSYLDFRDFTTRIDRMFWILSLIIFFISGHLLIWSIANFMLLETYKTNTLSVENACYIANELNDSFTVYQHSRNL